MDFRYATSNVSICFDDWNLNEPNNGNQQEHCVEFKKKGEVWKWNDVNCADARNFICEQSKC